MKISVVGTGYVGLVTGTCLAESGNEVVCIDIDQSKIERLQRGEVPIYEPGLAELIERNVQHNRLSFTTDLKQGIHGARCVFIAVGTPQREDGSSNLDSLEAVVREVAQALEHPTVVVVKSTVPVGTNAWVAKLLAELCVHPCQAVSNPEFLKEGAAVDDFNRPDRVVIGARDAEAVEVMRQLYAPFLRTEHPFLAMSPESSEMTKYVANAMLATKISFINEMANLCEAVRADINDVRRGIGFDKRIGFEFLFPGVGYGGSCFPKDIRALVHVAQNNDVEPRMMVAVDNVNEAQKQVLGQKILAHFRQTSTAHATVAIWGLSFKPRTDDIREAPARVLIDTLLAADVRLRVHDPVALPNLRAVYGNRLSYCDLPYGALEQADALAICTEWNEYRHPDFELMRRLMRQPVIFDGRNLYEPQQITGFTYHSIGRQTVRPDDG